MKSRLTLLLSLAALSALPAAGEYPATESERQARGTLRSIMSAQGYHRKTYPDAGFACDVARLVEVQALSDELARQKAFKGYTFTVACKEKDSPQTTFQAWAVPADKAAGRVFCTDEGWKLKVGSGPADCLAKGEVVK